MPQQLRIPKLLTPRPLPATHRPALPGAPLGKAMPPQSPQFHQSLPMESHPTPLIQT
jgi:hypothetical protein